MREYPRLLSKGRDDRIIVQDEEEEREAGTAGYESHWNPEVNKKQKGTASEVLKKAVEKKVATKTTAKTTTKASD